MELIIGASAGHRRAWYKGVVSPILREVGVAYALAFVGTALLGLLGDALAPLVGGSLGSALSELAGAGTALLFFGLAVRGARRAGGLERAGIAFEGLIDEGPAEAAAEGGQGAVSPRSIGLRALGSALREAGVALLVALVVFPPFIAGFWLYNAPSHGFRWAPPDDLASFALSQIVVVGLPEEAFFRGYVQARLEALWPPSRSLLGAKISPPALLAQAALFALVHLAVEPRLDKLATFFPGLLFGWLRARRGGVGASIALHALSNVLASLLVRGWLA